MSEGSGGVARKAAPGANGNAAQGATRAALDHIAVACGALRDLLPLYTDGLGLPLQGIEEVPGEGVRVAMLGGGGTRVELLEPTSEAAGVARFLAKQGPGLHHIAVRVDDITAALERARRAGASVIEPAPRPGAGGSRVAFLHPKSTQGVMVELVEPGQNGELDS